MATHPDRNSDLEKLCDSDPTWPYEAYEFILEAIELASDIQEPGSAEIHLSGRQIALAAKQLAIEWFGLMAPTVFSFWGVASTRDMGELVFKLIEFGMLTRQEGDRIEDFDDIFAIPDDLVSGYRIILPLDHSRE